MDKGVLARRGIAAYLRYYHRHEIVVDTPLPGQCLIIGNRGLGGVADLNVLCVVAALDRAGTDRPVTALVHQIGWTMGAGPLLEAIGCRPGSPEAFEHAVAAGHHVLVHPGGAIEASRSYRARNEIRFCGRTGYARMAIGTRARAADRPDRHRRRRRVAAGPERRAAARDDTRPRSAAARQGPARVGVSTVGAQRRPGGPAAVRAAAHEAQDSRAAGDARRRG